MNTIKMAILPFTLFAAAALVGGCVGAEPIEGDEALDVQADSEQEKAEAAALNAATPAQDPSVESVRVDGTLDSSAVELGAAAQPAPEISVIGGDVIRHDSIQNLVIAKDIRNHNAGFGGNCTIWNWNGGSSYAWVSGSNAVKNCNTASMNGRTYSWTVWSDTDAFTMQYEPYWVKMRDGTWRRIGANVYTKITDVENVHCYRESDGVNCYVSLG